MGDCGVASVAVGHAALDAAIANYPGSAVHPEEWDTGYSAASENLACRAYHLPLAGLAPLSDALAPRPATNKPVHAPNEKQITNSKITQAMTFPSQRPLL
jgi:hypothetical protein